MRATIKTDDGRFFTGDMMEAKVDEPRVGQICEFSDDKKGWSYSMLAVNYTDEPWLAADGERWSYARVCRNPLTLGRTMAPEGAEWIAPWDNGLWAYFESKPTQEPDGWYLEGIMRNENEIAIIFPAPTDGYKPIKLWEDE